MYNWQFPDWPEFIYDKSVIDSIIIDFALDMGEMVGLTNSLPEDIKQDSILQMMISEALKTSEIEGEYFSRQDIMSSIKRQIGIEDVSSFIKDKNADGIGSLMVEVRRSYKEALSEGLIKNWHGILMASYSKINAGEYRKSQEPMQIVSGSNGKEVVHFEAPPSSDVPKEMQNFVKWYNNFKVTETDIARILIKTSIAHLYFETIHPFEDGNGRIGRAIAEKCLFQSFGKPLILSLSSIIEKDRPQYYKALKSAQKSLEITEWVSYFSEVIAKAQKQAKQTILFTVYKTKFLSENRVKMNERQLKAVLKMFDFGIENFQGSMTAKKYVSICKTSRATATRDLQDLSEKQILTQSGEGRNVNYKLNL